MPKKQFWKTAFPLSLRDSVYCAAIVLIFSGLTHILHIARLDNQMYTVMIFFLGVVMLSGLTAGYFYGILGAVIFMFEINFFFTEPYLTFDFRTPGHLLTFCVMLLVAIVISALTTQIQQQEQIRIETENEKIRGNLLRAISHDLRTPLTSIIGSTGALLDNDEKITPKERAVLLTDIHEEANWLLRVVENLLSVTRIGGTAQIRKENEVAEEVISEAVQKFRRHFPNAAVKVRVPEEMLFVPMDAMLIEQVLNNLMENAVRHAEGMTQIEVTVTKEEDFARFYVTDDGKGISKALLPVIFDGTVHTSGTDTVGRNMGIGLSVCKSIVTAHQGTISAKNIKKGGAQFCFALPLEGQTYEDP